MTETAQNTSQLHFTEQFDTFPPTEKCSPPHLLLTSFFALLQNHFQNNYDIQIQYKK
jgi:hypothetical protein